MYVLYAYECIQLSTTTRVLELVLYAYSSNMHKYFSATPRIMHTVVHHDVYELVSAIV